MQEALRDVREESAMRLTVGLSNALPKLIAYRLLEPVLDMKERVRLVCYEGEFDSLVADLALHKLDVVLADRPVVAGANLRVFSHGLRESDVMIFGSEALARQYRRGFPGSLDKAPVLLPTRNNALRQGLDQWFENQNVRPRVVSEFEDSALLMTFGGTGLGLFPASSALVQDIRRQFGAVPIGEVGGVREHFFAISNERRIRHPAVEAIRNASHRPAQE
jgi:LysR family transcriptional activator of nhaA